ncbi:(4Fe-4S)-binding protein [Roseivirga misakiensis]|uniref:(4Fe-4S)-binding protein n=1 Tax=Roseivirga misakiensis TaxID=1563681 RepID=UPI000B48B7FA|nr:(4Fe-4S)-binding protein [Roseivirga misakiensis]
MEEPVIKEYSSEEVTVVWEPAKCIHSGICLRGLPKVFDLKSRPWVNINGSDAKSIVETVRECPSKALTIKGVRFKDTQTNETDVTLITGGPLIIKGGATIHHRKKTEQVDGTVSFCRCGRSQKFPYCDGSHAKPKDK